MGIAGWLLRRPGRRVAATLLLWAGVAAVLAWRAEPIVWLGAALGAMMPVSLWIAWNGPHVSRKAPGWSTSSR